MISRAIRTLNRSPFLQGKSVESRLRREQLLIIERTSRPGVVSAIVGVFVLSFLAFQPGYEDVRTALLGINLCMTVMAALWAFTLRACRSEKLIQALVGQLSANLMGTIVFFVFVDRGAILAVFTALVAVSSGAMVFDDRLQRRVTLLAITVALSAAAIGEAGLVAPVVLPPVVLYPAVAVTIILGLRNPISAFRLFNQYIETSRNEALRNERLAEQAREDAAAHARELEVVSADLREFMYVVSHDLRAPLINIEGFGQVLDESLDDFHQNVTKLDPEHELAKSWTETRSEVSEALHFIAGGIKKMDGLIKGLLELSRIDRGPIREENVSLDELLDEIVKAVAHQIRERDIEIDVAPLPDIVGERLRIGQVFGNLIDNAVKYMPERDPKQISVSCEEQDDRFVFSVSDSGDGVAPEYRVKIFRLFKRLSVDDGVGGEGIGLAAVKKIVERHGGRIWVEDRADGPGARFRFTWPRRPSVSVETDVVENAAA